MKKKRPTIYVNKQAISKNDIIWKEEIIDLLILTITLYLTSMIFSKLYIENILYAFMGALIISGLNYFVKPLIHLISIGFTISTLGITLPLTNILSNVIILELTNLILRSHFILKGFFSPIVIAIFISFLKVIIEKLIKKEGR